MDLFKLFIIFSLSVLVLATCVVLQNEIMFLFLKKIISLKIRS